MIQCVIAKPLGLLLFINIETDFDQNNRILYMYDYVTKISQHPRWTHVNSTTGEQYVQEWREMFLSMD
jgi:hypothetical protein